MTIRKINVTLDKFIKSLEALRETFGGRIRVTVDKDSLNDGNGSWSICDVEGAILEVVPQSDDDGAVIVNADGSQRTRKCVVITGSRV